MDENVQKIIKNILRDIQVELTDEFDQNFERQAFFSQAWQRRKSPVRNEGRAILVDTGQLRRSIKSRINGDTIAFYTDLPYAAIHNDGGEIVVTARMKRFLVIGEIDSLDAGRNARHYLVGNRVEPLGKLRDGQMRAENLHTVAHVTVDIRNVNHADIHTDISHIGSRVPVYQTISISVTQMPIQSVGIANRNGCDAGRTA